MSTPDLPGLPSLNRNKAFVNGQWTEAANGARFEVRNPADGSLLASVPDFSRSDAAFAIEAAAAAWPSYRDLNASERSKYLRRLYELVLSNQRSLATIMTLESGKVIRESEGEVLYGASFLEWFAEEAKRVYGDIIPPPSSDRRIAVIRQPVGVVGAITPWNFPLAMITRKVAPALAAGCTVVVKVPAETPLTGLALAALVEEAGFPPGVFNVITSSDSAGIGKELCEHPLVRKLSFTGSTEVGRQLMAQSAAGLKKLSLELGGNAPFIVFNDADIDRAVEGAVLAKFRHNGQTCVCANRILVQEEVYESFVNKFTDAVNGLVSGDVMDPAVQVGPLIHDRALQKVEAHISDALQKGATITTGGKTLRDRFFKPTVIRDARTDMRISKEEVFGPVAPIFHFSSEAEAIAMANDTEYGLAAYLYSRDIGRCWRVAEALEYGMVGVNEGLISTAVAPFGGIKASGFGREGSKYGIHAYTELKYLCFGGIP